MAKNEPLDFQAVQAAEVKAGIPPRGKALGLAFSGGGIRSATFNLGVIQALAELKLLQRFDYLSTISGGGYIGSWLSLFIRRYAGGDLAKAEKELLARGTEGLEHRAIRFLRAFSNYLTPRIGLSKDTLVAIATYLRNLLLNLSILVTLLGALLLAPRVGALLADRLTGWDRLDNWYDAIMLAALLAPTFVIALSLLYRPPEHGVHRPWYMRSRALIALVDLPVLAAAFFTATLHLQVADPQKVKAYSLFRTVLIAYILLWALGVVLALVFQPRMRQKVRGLLTRDKAAWMGAFVLLAAIAGALGAGLFVVIAKAIAALPEAHRLWAGLTFGPPAVIAAMMLMVVAHVGFMGRKFGEADRELWSVFGARLLWLMLCWTAMFGVAFYGAAAIGWANEWVVGLGGAAWVLSTLFGVVAGTSRKTGTPEANRAVELFTHVAPYVFVAGLLLALSWGVHRALEAAPGARRMVALQQAPAPAPGAPTIYLRAAPSPGSPVVTAHDETRPDLWHRFLLIAEKETASIRRWFDPFFALPAMALAAFLAALLMSWRVNINVFSLHHFYRNRIMRCYLGATNPERTPHALTGFDEADDVTLRDLAGQRPLHIVGTAINLNRGRQLAWQSRRAASFAFTPLHAGYEPASAQVSGGFRHVGEYGLDGERRPMNLSTVVAISGAAASPNMGYHTSPAVAFLLAVFNVRLGHWCGDTGHPRAWRQRDPVLGLRYWLAELTGTADQDYPFVNLSDGGHFENLGVYELVRRQCKLILASDAGADPRYAFEDLAEAMRKCYTDFGVEFRFKGRIEDIRPPEAGKPSARHHAVAEIVYPNGAPPGTLVYWKSSLTADMPPDIVNYGSTRKDFPHETTADQFFDESQFESYRRLGYEVAMRSIDAMKKAKELPAALA